MTTCSSDTFPFLFYDESGDKVSGVADDNGICTFPDADCGIGSSGKCCEPTPYVTGTNYMFIAFALIFLQNYIVRRYFGQIWQKDPALLENLSFDKTPNWIKNTCLKHLAWLWGMGIWVGIGVLVTIPTIMKPSIQANLDVSSRNVLQSAEAFLVPYKEIFQFVEDIVSIKINYALNSDNLEQVDTLLHLGLAGSLLTGLFASGLATILGVIPPVLKALTNPGLNNDLELYPGCDIVEAGADASGSILQYWMIEVWKFPGMQVAMVLTGFMYGALEYNTMGWIMSVGLLVLPIIWFTNISKSSVEPILLLAWGEFTVPYVWALLALVYMISPLGSMIRDDTGVKISFTKLCKSFCSLFRVGRNSALSDDEDADAEDADNIDRSLVEDSTLSRQPDESKVKETAEDGKTDVTTKELLVEGGCIMALDLCVQLSKSLAIYLALLTDAATAYQLTAMDSYLPSYGMAYATGMAFCIKIIGPIFLSMKEHEFFFKFARASMIITFFFIPLIVGCTVPFIEGLSLSSGQNACEYAGSTECVRFFTNVYGPNAEGGQYTLYYSFRAFAFGSIVEAIYIVARAVIVTMLDFRFILKSTGVAMIFYIVAIIVVSVAKPFAKEAISYWSAMFVPQVVLIFLFIGRMHTQFRRIVRGDLKGVMRGRFQQKMFGNTGNEVESTS